MVAQETVKLWEKAGIPAGVLNLVQAKLKRVRRCLPSN